MEIFDRQTLGEFFLPQDVLGEGLLIFLQFADFFFDAVLDEQAIGDDFIGLANAVRAINSLSSPRQDSTRDRTARRNWRR